MFEMIDDEKPDQERKELLRTKVVAYLVALLAVTGVVYFIAVYGLE